jgi:DNA polymerase-3 subunit epsilon
MIPLHLTRKLIVLDTETTGVNVDQDRIVEIAFQVWEPDDLTGRRTACMTKEWRSLVNPGVPIPEGARKIHGITDETMKLCRECGLPDREITGHEGHAFKPIPTFKQLAANLAKGFTDCDYAGQNVRFDLRILAFEMKRAGQPWSYAGARIIDSGQLERLAVPRSLSHLHEKYVGMKHDGAHGALSDVRAAATVIMKQLEMHPTLPRDVETLHKAQWPGELDEGGKFKIVDGVATCQFGKYRGKAMRDIPNDYWDWLLKSDFPDDVKRLAGEAKLGKFPEGK